jgi:epoxyqueuosine reductase
MTTLTFEDLKTLAAEVGLSIVSVACPDELAGERRRLEAWQQEGLAAEMAYMNRPADLLTTPTRLLPSVKSIVVIAVFYERVPRPSLEKGYGRIARYAWGRDYHKVLRRRLEKLLEVVQRHIGRTIDYRVFADSVPLLERALANRSGLGFIGKNTMAILPKEGSFFFLGELLWDVEIESPTTKEPSSAHCGSCTNCISNCPTGAFVNERVLDAGKCISYLTIEKRSALTYQEREWLGEWLFGCDVCQEVCPFNIVPLKKRLTAHVPELSAEAGVGPVVSLDQVLRMRTDEEYAAVFQGTAVMRAKRAGLARNAAIVAANTHVEPLLPLLREVVLHDASGLVRRHALWAGAIIASKVGEVDIGRMKTVLDTASQDSDVGVREECGMIRTQLRKFA